MSKCVLVKRGYMYDIYINNQYVGKGQLPYIHTAYLFYAEQGMDVEIVDE